MNSKIRKHFIVFGRINYDLFYKGFPSVSKAAQESACCGSWAETFASKHRITTYTTNSLYFDEGTSFLMNLTVILVSSPPSSGQDATQVFWWKIFIGEINKLISLSYGKIVEYVKIKQNFNISLEK